MWMFGLEFLGKLGDWLNGKKTLLGVISLVIAALAQAHVFIPACEGVCPQIAEALTQGLLWLGVVLTPTGAVHKALKAKK